MAMWLNMPATILFFCMIGCFALVVDSSNKDHRVLGLCGAFVFGICFAMTLYAGWLLRTLSTIPTP